MTGLGDFLKDRAKQELIAYAVSVFGRELCATDGKLRSALVVDGRFVFEKSCATAFPNDDTLDYTAFSDGRFQKAFSAEVVLLPSAAVDLAIAQLTRLDKPTKDVLKALARAVLGELGAVAAGTFTWDHIVQRIDTTVRSRLMQGSPSSLGCDLPSKAFGPGCAALLGLRLAAATSEAVSFGLLDELSLLKKAGSSFCTDYGKDHGSAPADALACIGLDAGKMDAAFDDIVKLTTGEVSNHLLTTTGAALGIDLMALVANYRDAYAIIQEAIGLGFKGDKRKQIASGLRKILTPTFDAARKWLVCPASQVPTDESAEAATKRKRDDVMACNDNERAALDIVGYGIDAVLSLGANDLAALDVALKSVLAVPAVKTALGDKAVRAANLALDLGTVESADEAKKVFEHAAEPLGSYRAKYDAGFLLTLNGFVGPRMGALVPLNRNKALSSGSKPVRLDAIPLGAPVGLDFSFKADAQHIGFTILAFDPLGMVTIDTDEGAVIDWGAVLTPGLQLRWGVQRSPFDLYIAGVYEPLRRPEVEVVNGEELLGYEGAFSVGGGVAIDIPILFLASH